MRGSVASLAWLCGVSAAVCNGGIEEGIEEVKDAWPMLRKAYHRKNTSSSSDATKWNGEELKKGSIGAQDAVCWIRDERTGIYYPRGQEKVIEDVPRQAGKDFGVNWFSNTD
ncbi:hypothetical protein LguiA_028455 [Lonicera macranthoides]